MKPITMFDRAWEHASKLSLATWIRVLGLYFYSSQAHSYELFYRQLSVDLEDIGLNYTTVLARSRLQIITPLFIIGLAVYALRRGHLSVLAGEWSAGRAHAGKWSWLRRGKAWLKPLCWSLVSIVCLLAMTGYIIATYDANNRIRASAAAIRDGRTITEVESETGMSILNVRMPEASIEPVAATDVPAVLKGLAGRQLLYIGQKDNTLVLFDPIVDRAVYVPRNSVVLSVNADP
jgi:hypothetical protein